MQCQICQVENEDSAQFCRECGGRLAAPKPSITAPAPQTSTPADAPTPPPPAPARPKLRSPLFGGGGGGDEEAEGQPVLNKSKSKGLRSPLLRNDDDDEPLADQNQNQKINNSKSRGGGGLRSPIFGGGGDKNKDHKSTFPHRTHEFDQEEEPRPSAKLEPGRHQSKGLRSPLLGGDDFDPEAGISEDPGIQGKAAGQVKAHHRLRSPIFGDVADGYEDELFDEEAEDVDDPTVLRSPLLAVKARPKTNLPPQPNQAPGQTPAAPEQAKTVAPMQMQSPLSKIQQMQQAQQSQQAQPLSGYGQGQANLANPTGFGAQSNPASFSATGTNPAAPPPAPTSAPSYEPRPAPSPTNSQYSMAAQNVQPTPAAPQPYSQPAQPGQASGGYDYGVQPSAPSPLSAPTPSAMPAPSPMANPSAKPLDDGKKGLRGSKLLATGDSNNDDDDEDLLNMGPKDRRSKSRERRAPRTDRRAGLDVDDDDEILPMAGGRRLTSAQNGGGNPMAPLLMASAALALVCKLYGFLPLLTMPDIFTKYLASTVDAISSMIVLVCLILFSLKAWQKE